MDRACHWLVILTCENKSYFELGTCANKSDYCDEALECRDVRAAFCPVTEMMCARRSFYPETRTEAGLCQFQNAINHSRLSDPALVSD
jgi:hypothetical protein